MRRVVLLRGVNVGGNTTVSMAELKVLFTELGFENVKTYINSGNIAFDEPLLELARNKNFRSNESGLIELVERSINERFNLRIKVMSRVQPAIRTILKNNPFAGQFESHKEMHVLFMKDEMPKEKEDLLLEKQTDDERFVVRGREIYCHLRLGVADSLIGKGFIEKKLKVPVTARNWRTVQKLTEL